MSCMATLPASWPDLIHGCPVRFLWTRRMALILLCSKRLATFWDTEKDQAMLHHNSVFHGLLKHVPWDRFDRLVEEHGADARVRRLSTKGQFIALLYGQRSGSTSLREIVTGLGSHSARLYHLGADPVRRSTLSDANAQRPVAVFSELLAMMMKQAHRGLRRKLGETTYLIDATSIRLNEHSASWARFSTGVCGAKVHVIYDADADRPIYAAVSAANVNDITVAQQMPIEAGATYVFDLGYYDYAWWSELDAIGCRIITRFIGNSENAVRIQIAIALITFLLLRLAQAAQKAITSPIVFARLVRANLMHRRAIDYLLHPPPNLTQHQLQLSLGLCQI